MSLGPGLRLQILEAKGQRWDQAPLSGMGGGCGPHFLSTGLSQSWCFILLGTGLVILGQAPKGRPGLLGFAGRLGGIESRMTDSGCFDPGPESPNGAGLGLKSPHHKGSLMEEIKCMGARTRDRSPSQHRASVGPGTPRGAEAQYFLSLHLSQACSPLKAKL